MGNTSADLRSLLDRLTQAQHALIEDAARQPGLPSTAIIRRIAELENTIAAVLALIGPDGVSGIRATKAQDVRTDHASDAVAIPP